MPFSNIALFLTVLAGLPYSCMASPTDGYSQNKTTSVPTAPHKLEACGVVAKFSALAKAKLPNDPLRVNTKLALDCLNSVPLNKTAALDYVTSIEPYIEWQSTLGGLKDPPADYFFPPVDVLARLASVKSNLENDVYPNEYEFQKDLYLTINSAHDGHLVVYPDLLTEAFDWRRQRSLVSISRDGVEVPKIYLYEDIIAAPSKASAVTEINGIDAVKYVEDWVLQTTMNQDPDAAYNTMFYQKAFIAIGGPKGFFRASGRHAFIFPGSNTTFGFENGTSLVTENYANVRGNFTGVTDGKSFYQKFCDPQKQRAPRNSQPAPTGPIVKPDGYPTPVIITHDTVAGGYYLDKPGFEDVAVLSFLNFEPNSTKEFQAVQQAFLEGAVRDGKTKIIVDLQVNGGGYVLQAYDAFRQFFPHFVQDGNSRMRENELFMTIAEMFSEAIPDDYDPKTASGDTIFVYQNSFNYRWDINLTNQPFLTFEDKFAPHNHKGTKYTNLIRENLEDPMNTSNATYGYGMDISGYGSRKNLTQHFAAEDIVMIYDGYCGSTCAIFSEFMLKAGVKSIAFGGRPSSGAIQGVGGVKGAQVLDFENIYWYAKIAGTSSNATDKQLAIIDRHSWVPIGRSLAASINYRDQILSGNVNDGLAAQFVRQEADCKLYWTAEMIMDVEKIWEAAAKAAWGGGACAAGAGFPNGNKNGTRSSKTHLKKRFVNNWKKERNTLDMETKDNVKKDMFWHARHGKKIFT